MSHSITVHVPITFTEKDFKQPNWPQIEKMLLDNARSIMQEELRRETRRQGWSR